MDRARGAKPARRRRTERVTLLALVLLPAGGIARAQEAAVPGSPANEFHLTAAFGARASSNARFVPDANDPGDPNPVGDYIADFRPDLAVRRKTDRTDWSLHYQMFVTRYHELQDLDSLNQALSFGGAYDLSRRVKLLLSERYSYTQDPLLTAAPDQGDTAFLTTPNTRWTSTTDAGMDIALDRDYTLLFGATARVDRYEVHRLADTNAYTQRAGIRKLIGREQTLSVTYTHGRFLPDTEGTPDTNGNQLALTWAHDVPGHYSLELTGGGSRVERGTEIDNYFTGGGAFHRVMRHGGFEFGYRRSLSTDTGADEVTVADSVYSGIDRTVGRSGHVGLGVDFGWRKSALPPSVGTGLNLRYAGATVRGDWTFSDRLGLTGEGMVRRQRTTGDTEDEWSVNALFVGLNIRIY